MISRIWLTYKQHRFETIAVTVICLGAADAADGDGGAATGVVEPASLEDVVLGYLAAGRGIGLQLN